MKKGLSTVLCWHKCAGCQRSPNTHPCRVMWSRLRKMFHCPIKKVRSTQERHRQLTLKGSIIAPTHGTSCVPRHPHSKAAQAISNSLSFRTQAFNMKHITQKPGEGMNTSRHSSL